MNFLCKSHVLFRASTSEISELSANGNLKWGWIVDTLWWTVIYAEFLAASTLWWYYIFFSFFISFWPIYQYTISEKFEFPVFSYQLITALIVGLNTDSLCFPFPCLPSSTWPCCTDYRNWQLVSLGRLNYIRLVFCNKLNSKNIIPKYIKISFCCLFLWLLQYFYFHVQLGKLSMTALFEKNPMI